MRLIRLNVVLILGLFSLVYSQNYSIDRYVIASGGGEMASTNYASNGTIGQPVTGSSSSGNYGVNSGYWAGGGGGSGGGCDYVVGDVNGSDNYNGLDITYGVAFFKGGSSPQCVDCPPCNGFYYCGDVNASCNYNGLDITYGVSYFKGGAGPQPCADCPPAVIILLSRDPRGLPVSSVQSAAQSAPLKIVKKNKTVEIRKTGE